jgi:hypothetical protein
VTNGQSKPTIKALIERSSLGSADARAVRSRVPIATGRAVARSSMTGRFDVKKSRGE